MVVCGGVGGRWRATSGGGRRAAAAADGRRATSDGRFRKKVQENLSGEREREEGLLHRWIDRCLSHHDITFIIMYSKKILV